MPADMTPNIPTAQHPATIAKRKEKYIKKNNKNNFINL